MKAIRFWLALPALAYTAFFLTLSNVPFTDAPNHLARAVIMDSLWSDPHSPFLADYSASHFFMPYMLPDLGMIALLRVFGTGPAYPVYATITMLALAFAIWFYARQFLTTKWAMAALILCSWYVATNYLFVLGFFAYQWGVAASFVALAALEAWRRKGNRAAWIVIYIVACIASYGSHVACFAILAVLVGATGLLRAWRKEETWLQFAGELLPVLLLAAYHLILVPAHPEAFNGGLAKSTLFDKVGRFIGSIFIRKSYFTDMPLLLLFLAILVGTIRKGIGRAGHRELRTVCLLATIGYFLLPIGSAAGWYVDERMLPFFFIPLLVLGLSMLENAGNQHRKPLLIACGVLVAANLAALAWFLPGDNREVARYREALSKIPERQTVLSIDTRRANARSRPLRHSDSFVSVDRKGFTPYLFSSKTGGGPAGYFFDQSPIFRPAKDGYLKDEPTDWAKVRETYTYVVVTKPWREEKIDRTGLELLFENETATVFRVRR